MTPQQEDAFLLEFLRATYWGRDGFRPQLRNISAEKREELLMRAMIVVDAYKATKQQEEWIREANNYPFSWAIDKGGVTSNSIANKTQLEVKTEEKGQ